MHWAGGAKEAPRALDLTETHTRTHIWEVPPFPHVTNTPQIPLFPPLFVLFLLAFFLFLFLLVFFLSFYFPILPPRFAFFCISISTHHRLLLHLFLLLFFPFTSSTPLTQLLPPPPLPASPTLPPPAPPHPPPPPLPLLPLHRIPLSASPSLNTSN